MKVFCTVVRTFSNNLFKNNLALNLKSIQMFRQFLLTCFVFSDLAVQGARFRAEVRTQLLERKQTGA
jgi:hypothetical protein